MAATQNPPSGVGSIVAVRGRWSAREGDVRPRAREMLGRAPRIKALFRRSPRSRNPRPRNPIPFLTDLKSTADPSAALRLLLDSDHRRHPDFPPSCAALIYRLARSHHFPQLETLLDFLKTHQIPCKESPINAVIHHFGRARLPDKALQLFFQLPSFNSSGLPNSQTLNHVLNALVDNASLDRAEGLFARCRELGIRPNAVSYNIILKGKCERSGLGLDDAARWVFDEMRKTGVRASVVTYNILIGSACRKGELDRAMELKDEMGRKGADPNAVTYALLMEGLCLLGKYNEARKLMFDMEYQGCKVKLMNYGVLMSDCVRRRDMNGLQKLLAEMKRRKLKPDVVTYSILINHLCADGRMDEAYKLIVEMQIKRCEPNAAIYRMMVDGFCRAGEFEKGLQVASAMLACGHCPLVGTLACLISGLCEGGRVDDACTVLEEMVRRKMRLEIEGWVALVRVICRGCDDQILLLAKLTSMCGGTQGLTIV